MVKLIAVTRAGRGLARGRMEAGRAMRLRTTALALALAGIVLAVTGPAAGSGVPGAPGEPSITIRAIGRSGEPVPVTASLQSPRACAACVDETLTSAHPTRVAKGSYNIAAWIQEPDGTARTLAARELTVTASRTVTFDARQGRPIRFTVDDPTVTQDSVEAEPFSPDGWDAFDGYRPVAGQQVYAVPGTMAPGYHLYLQADLARPRSGGRPSPVEYVLVRLLGRTIPANLTFAASRSGLAGDRVTVREIDHGSSEGIRLEPRSDRGALGRMLPATLMGQTARTPFSVDFEVTPGYRWQAQTGSGTMNLNRLPLLRAGPHRQAFDRAVYGPSPEFGVTVAGGELQPTVQPWGGYLLDDPTQEQDTSPGLRPAATQAWVYQGRKLLAHTRDRGFSVPVPAVPRWYTVKILVQRNAGSRLFTAELLSCSFRAWAGGPDPGQAAFWPRLIPSGLSPRNAARPGSLTTVPIRFTALSGDIAARNVRAWASDDDGGRWTALPVSGHGRRWSAVVPNPARPGFVSLRVQGTAAGGATAAVTVTRAYAVS